MIATLLAFVIVCLATAFVCTAVKEDEDQRLAFGTGRLFGVMAELSFFTIDAPPFIVNTLSDSRAG